MGGYKEHKIFDILERKNFVIKYVAAIVLVFVLVLIFGVQIINETTMQNEITYTENSDLDYKVYLKDNEFFSENYLDEEKHYIATLIDYINADYEYKVDFSDKTINYDYKYKIMAEIKVIDKTSQKALYEYNDLIVNEKSLKGNSKSQLKIDENVKIDYNKYNDLIKKFVNLYDLENYTATVFVNMYTEIDENDNDKKPVISLQIPLTTDTMAIDIESNTISNNQENITKKTNIEKYTFLLILFIALDITLGVKLAIFINDTKNEENIYKMRLRKIMSNYGSYIQKMNNEYEIGTRQILEIKSFEDLLQIK